MVYDLKFRHENEKRGYWHTTINAENDDEAIEKAKEYIKDKNYKNVKIVKTIYKEKMIFDFDKAVE